MDMEEEDEALAEFDFLVAEGGDDSSRTDGQSLRSSGITWLKM